MRVRYPSVAEMAQQVLREVEADDRIKTAERQVLAGTLHPRVQTATAQGLVKLAEHCRKIDINNPEVTYNDLRAFMAACDAE
jgi:hypothetical protein